LTGHIDEAQAHCADARRLEVPDDSGVAMLTRGVGFMAATARDPSTAAPPTSESPDPVAWMGWLAVAEGLVLAGRFDEAMSVLADDRTLPAMSALDGMTRGLLRGLFLTLTGRPADARPFLDSARASAGSV